MPEIKGIGWGNFEHRILNGVTTVFEGSWAVNITTDKGLTGNARVTGGLTGILPDALTNLFRNLSFSKPLIRVDRRGGPLAGHQVVELRSSGRAGGKALTLSFPQPGQQDGQIVGFRDGDTKVFGGVVLISGTEKVKVEKDPEALGQLAVLLD